MKTSLAIVLGALPLAACISFGAKPPPSLLTLTTADRVPVGQVVSSAGARGIAINVPTTPASLATARVPVQVTPTTIAYVQDAQWTEPPARLFARLLSDTVQARTGRVVLTAAQAIDGPSGELGGELRQFGLDATTRQAVVTFDASLRRDGSQTLEKRWFEARVPIATIDATTSGTALNDAANQVALQVADWVGR